MVALTLRFWNLTTIGLNSDEAVYAGQAAALANIEELRPYFPAFRAHPLLFQSILSIPYGLYGVDERTGRALSALFGMGTILLTYFLARQLVSSRAIPWFAAAITACMPYLVVTSRQIILDGPMTCLGVGALFSLARYAVTRRSVWLYTTSAALGCTFLTKETAIILYGSAYLFLAMTPSIPVRIKHMAGATTLFFFMVSLYPLSVAWAGAKKTGGNFLIWQLFRQANHEWWFYPVVVTPAMGYAVVGLALWAVWARPKVWSWQIRLLVSWLAVPCVFFQLWAVKGYQYLLPAAPAVAILAAMGVVKASAYLCRRVDRLRARTTHRRLTVLICGLVCLSLVVPSWNAVNPTVVRTTFLAGTGGVPGGREAGLWVSENLPEGVELLALGPSMANIIQFYGQRRTYGISVSPNPLHRNPVYDPVSNPDLRIRRGEIQYLVWDSFSASRSEFFSESLMKYVKRYNGIPVHTEYVEVEGEGGMMVRKPIIIIYRVRP